jgi:phosphohistidine phosphatase
MIAGEEKRKTESIPASLSFRGPRREARMKTLLLLRHAKSSWDDPELDDHDRPLNARGRRDAPRIGRLVRDEEIAPDIVLCSTAERARETAEAVAEATGYSGEVRFLRALYLAGPREIVAALKGLEPDVETAMVVGHNPGLEELVQSLTGQSEHLPTAALARIALPIARFGDLVPSGRGKLVRIWRPKDLD